MLGGWFAMFLRIEATYADLRRAFGATPESEVVSVMYDAHTEYTKLVAETVGDDGGWLEWYLWENGGGEKQLEAQAPGWRKARKIKNLKDLEAIIKALGVCKQPNGQKLSHAAGDFRHPETRSGCCFSSAAAGPKPAARSRSSCPLPMPSSGWGIAARVTTRGSAPSVSF